MPTRAVWAFPIAIIISNKMPSRCKLREQYVAHVRKMLELAGEPAAQAAADAHAVMHIETELAKGSLDRVSRRDPEQDLSQDVRQRAVGVVSQHRLAEVLRRAWARPLSPI